MEKSIEDRIKKLLALSNSDFPEEAKSAMLKAQQLMQQHGIQMSSLTTNSNSVSIEDLEINTGKKTISMWESMLATIIAKNFRCTVYIHSTQRYSKLLKIFGEKDDVSACIPVIEFAMRSMNRCWQKYSRERKNELGQNISKAVTFAIRNDYMRSFITGVAEAFQKQVNERAIVLVKHPTVKKYEYEKGLRKGTKKYMNSADDSHARIRGYTDGRSIRGGKYINRV